MFTMYSTCFEPEGSSSGRRLYVQVWCSMFSMHRFRQSCVFHKQICLQLWHVNKLYHTCTYSFLPEDEPAGSKHLEDTVKIKILF